MKIITCIGYHDTGSSAVDDFFREFKCFNLSIADMECRMLQDPDGISDLEYNLVENPHRLNSGYAIKRFRIMMKSYYRLYSRIFGPNWFALTEEYINNLIKIKYKGYWHADILLLNPVRRYIYLVRRRINKMLPKRIAKSNWYNYFPNIDTYHCQLTEKEFLETTQKYMEKLCEDLSSPESTYIIFDQLVHPNNIPRYLRYVNNLKVIVVDRDPRDIYIEEALYEECVLPKDPMQFAQVYRDSRKPTAIDTSGASLNIQFEDLIYRYEETTMQIMDFIGLMETEHIAAKKYFDPNQSIKNTKLWEKHPEFNDAVRIIEQELPDFLYRYN